MKRTLLAIVGLMLIFSQCLMAIHQDATEDGHLLPYSQKMTHPLDEPVNAALKNRAFMMNLGPTGIRADIRPEYPKAFKVKFVFQDSHSPAKGLIKPGDMIIGAGGKEFKNPHKFHRKKGGRGWPGPPYELAHAIEAAQGSDGKLSLIVLQGGNKGKKKTVTLQLKPVGRFSPTWPVDCPRSDQLLKDLLDFMLDEGNISRMKRHQQIQALLAVWASGDKRAMPLVKSQVQSALKSRPDFRNGGMGQTWMTGYRGILLGEYYHATKDKRVKAAAENFKPFYRYAQFENGSYGHRSAISFIATGRKPYASMAACGGICMLAQSTFRANGLEYSPVAYERTHQGYLRTAGPHSGGSVAYGFANHRQAERPTDHAVLKLKSKKGIKEPKPRPWWPELGGKNLPIEGGLAAIGEYEVVWPHPKDHRWRDGCIDWLKKESGKVSVMYGGKDADMVTAWRYLPEVVIKEPTSPYRTTPNGCGHQAGPGPGALAHLISNKGNKSWEYLGMHMANGCALSPKMLWDGHADAVIHAFFGALAAFQADKKNLRSWLDYTKTWIILSETHEPRAKGGLVDQPFGCQRNGTCSIARGRTAYTHVAIAILSAPKRRLLLTGAPHGSPEGGNPALQIQDADFKITHCKKEAKMLEKGTPFMKVFESLLKSLEKAKEEQKAEAQQLGDRLKKYVISRTGDLMAEAQKKPAKTLPALEDWHKKVEGLPPEESIAARIEAIEAMPEIKVLLKAYKDYESTIKTMQTKGASKSTDKKLAKIRKSLDKFVAEEGVDAVLKAEAKELRISM